MKKNIIIAALLLLALGTATAQDTVVSLTPKSSYFYNYWPDIDTTEWHLVGSGRGTTAWGVDGMYFCFPPGEEVLVYGIAAGMYTYDLDLAVQHYPDSSTYYGLLDMMVDTIADSAYEYWGIYKHVGGALELASPQLKVNIKTTPVSYYWDINAYGAVLSLDEKKLIPMYEMYFAKPQPVRDSFYLAMTNRIRNDNGMVGHNMYSTWPIFWSAVGAVVGTDPNFQSQYFNQPYIFCWRNSHGNLDWYYMKRSSQLLFIFPILEPDSTGIHNEDTTGVEPGVEPGGGDTLSVQEAMLWRSTVVLPNPARGEARVVSGVGLEQVEAYDAAGSRMGSWRATGSELRLDVSAWPEGAYMLRLTTPMGQVSKKLIVRR